jgi:hypothetical protein
MSVIPISDRELRARADVIVRGIVVSSEVAEDALGRPETVTVVAPLEILKGQFAGELVLHQLGGTLPDGQFFKLWGRPEYQPGHEVVVFAIARPEGDFQTAELLLGKFEVQQDEAGQVFAVPALVADAPAGVTVRRRAKDAPGDRDDDFAESSAPRELEPFLRALSCSPGQNMVSGAEPSGKLRSVIHAEYADEGARPDWANIDALWRWNNGASAVWTLDGQANVTGGGSAEASNATATWNAEPNSPIGYTIGSGSANPIHLNALSSPCGWTTCLSGAGVIGCGGPGGGGTNSWRGESYSTITGGEVWLRSYCSMDLYSSTITQSVLTHELGHTLGLGHSDQGASPHDVCRGDESLATMRATVQNRTTLGTDDSDAVRWLYGDGGNSCAAGGATAPAVTTNAAGGIGQTGATLNGTVNPNGASTTTAFDYGTTTSYGSTATAQTLTGSTSQAISAAVSGLACNTLHHFRAKGTNSAGTSLGSDATFTTAACSVGSPNLTPYQPAGWSDKIVVSNTTGTNTDSAVLNPTDTLYVDWVVRNTGTVSTATGFYTNLYVDGALVQQWFTGVSVSPGISAYALDFSIGSLAAGQHAIKIVADATGTIAESNETDNEYTKTISVQALAGLPTLTPFQPSSWSDKIVVSTTPGTNTDSPSFGTTDTLYVDWAVRNTGTAPTAASFTTALYVDNVFVNQWLTGVPVPPGLSAYNLDYPIGPLAAGPHTIKIVADSTGAVTESNEADNEYTKTITVQAPGDLPNLMPFKPASWSDKIVVSNTPGTNTDSASFSATDILYVDWAVRNTGTVATAAGFTTALYVDGVQVGQWFTGVPVPVGLSAYNLDFAIGPLPSGQHAIKIVADTTGAIAESSESDNTYTKTITVN